MTKTLTYSTFAVSALLIIFAFVTAKSYTQLGVAVVLYPLLAYFALKLFPRKTTRMPAMSAQVQTRAHETPKREKVEVADIDKRTFLKLVGAAGISFFFFSLLGRRTETLLFGKALESKVGTFSTSPQTAGDSPPRQPTDGYKITEIDDNIVAYYGFTSPDGAWFIMREDTDTGSFRYARGEHDFPSNWNNRKKLRYDYYSSVFKAVI